MACVPPPIDPGAGTTAGGATGGPTCDTYCDLVMDTCTGTNQQYTSKATCLKSCTAMAVGLSTDTSGNTLGCRIYHAKNAMTAPATHCAHAGPGGAGHCGSNCDGYCQIAMKFCNAANGAQQVYTDLADCKSTCAMFPDTVTFNVNTTGLDEQKQVACLLYHVQEASDEPSDHCNGDLAKSGALASVTCKN